MDAIVTAGGTPQPGDPLYPFTQGQCKALLDVAGKPMIQWILDALEGASKVENVTVIGLPADAPVHCAKPVYFLPNQAGMIENIRLGVGKLSQVHPGGEHMLLVSSDIPAITPAIVDWMVETVEESDHDIYYSVIPREVIEARFPGSKRSYVKLRGYEVCGGDLNAIRGEIINRDPEIWHRIIDARKSAVKQAALIGFDTLVLMLLRRITIAQAEKKVGQRLGLKGRAILAPYAEMGMDIDKPVQLDMVRRDLEKRYKQPARA
jgi:GTP:adenosylcobinamide-phosphate guanylyltransferase